MRKLLNSIKETFQYLGIILLSCLSALWLLLSGKRKE